MKRVVLAALAMFGAVATPGQDQTPCKAYFQVLRASAEAPGLRAGLDAAQKEWWENRGQKKYPGLCLDGSVMSADKPRYLVIWSPHSRSIGQASLPANEVYGQSADILQSTAPTARIYQPRWDKASVTIVSLLYDSTPLLPPVYFQADDGGVFDFPYGFVRPDSLKVFDAALKYLSQERALLSNPN